MTVASPAAVPVEVRRARTGARSTPALLRLALVGLVVLSLLLAALATVAAARRMTGTSAARRLAEPLMVRAQAIDTNLSDADSTIAGSFLQGRVPAAESRARYASDVAQAAALLSAAARESSADPSAAAPLRTLALDLPTYTGLVETATADERQAYYALAAAYLGEANTLMRTQMLPAASQVYETESATLARDEQAALSEPLVVAAGVLGLVLLAAIVVAQVWLARRFRRVVSVPLALATVILVALGVWFLAAATSQGSSVHRAVSDGSGPVTVFTRARILTLQLRADDELTLLTRDSVSSYQKDYQGAGDALERGLAAARGTAGPAERQHLDAVAAALAAFDATHREIRTADSTGDLASAVRVATGGTPVQLPAVAGALDQELIAAIDGSQQTFADAMTDAAGTMTPLVWAAPLTLLAAAGLVWLGIRPRLAEYR